MLLGTILTLLILGNCSGNKYTSQLATPDFRVDGSRSEWAGRFEIPEDQSFALGISNDKNYLYLAISSIDKGFQRQVSMAGLTIWLDHKGGKRQHFGVKYASPLSRENHRMPGAGRNNDFSRKDRLNNMRPLNLPDGDIELIIINAKSGKRLGPPDLLATASAEDESLFIEFQIPLILLGKNVDLQKGVGVGLVSSVDRPEREGVRSGGMSGGKMGGGQAGGQRGGGRGGGMRSGAGASTSFGENELDFWMKVTLSQ
mgnify:CR=1 FL=1